MRQADLVHPSVPLAATGISLLGLAVATYLTVAHFTTPHILLCAASGVVNCDKVTTSPQSTILGVPVAVLGLAFFAVMVPLNLPAAWRVVDRRMLALREAACVVGIGFVLYLVSAELFLVGAICLWCTAVHVLTFALLLVVTGATASAWPAAPPRRARALPAAPAAWRRSPPPASVAPLERSVAAPGAVPGGSGSQRRRTGAQGLSQRGGRGGPSAPSR